VGWRYNDNSTHFMPATYCPAKTTAPSLTRAPARRNGQSLDRRPKGLDSGLFGEMKVLLLRAKIDPISLNE